MPKIVKHAGSLSISLPPKILRALGIRKGDKLFIAIRGREIILRAENDTLASISTDDLLAELRRRGAN